MLDVQCFGLNPTGHHLTSILWHALNTILVFLFLRQMTRATWRSFFVAALFGLHPLRVESVAWVAERKDVLSAAFGLLMLWAYTRYINELAARPAKSRTYYVLAWLCFAAGLMCKPMLVTMPFVLLLLDFWPLGRFQKNNLSALVWEKTPFLALSIISSVVTFLVQRAGGAVDAALPLSYRIGNAAISYCRYLGKLLWPTDLTFFYPHPHQYHWPLSGLLAAGLVSLGITFLAVTMRKRSPYMIVGWLWFLGTLVPVIGLVQVGQQAIADRYTYLPVLGILVALVWGVHQLITRHPELMRVTNIAAVGLLVLCVILTGDQTRHWKNAGTLARHALDLNPDNYLARGLWGATLERQGDFAAAVREHLEAVRIKPDYSEGHNNLAVALQRQGRLAEAISHYQQALQLRPRYPEVCFNFGQALEQSDLTNEAADQYRRAIALRPDYADAHYNLGLLLGRLGQLNEAAEQFQIVLQLQPDSAETHSNLGVTFDRMGRFDEAIVQYGQALKLNPENAKTCFNLGVAFTRRKKLDEAIHYYQEALRLQPDYPQAQTNLDAVLSLKAAKPAK